MGRWRLVFAALVGAGIGCQVVLDIGDRSIKPPPCGIDSVPDGPRVRLANLVVGEQPVAVCLSPSNGGASVRVPKTEPGCPAGVGYPEVSAPAGLDAGMHHARVIPASADCDGAPLFERDVELGPNGNTLMWAGGGSRPLELYWFGESAPSKDYFPVRLIHAAPELGPLDLGLATAAGLPATVIQPLTLSSVAFGQSGAPAPPGVDENGYAKGLTGVNVNYGVADAGEVDAKTVSFIRGNTTKEHAFSIFAIGGVNGEKRRSLACDEQRVSQGFTECSVGQVVEPSFELFTPSIAGLIVPYREERLQALIEEIASFDSDVVCLTEFWPESAQTQVVDAALPAYPHSHRAKYKVDTPFTYPEGLDGTVPAPRSEPYCASPESKVVFEKLLDCVRSQCAEPASDEGVLVDPSCATTTCILAASALLPVAFQPCGLCALYMLGAGSTLSETRDLCTLVNEPYVFNGESGLLLLSRFPLEDPSTFLAPSTLVRRDIIYARVRHPTGAAADVYCGYSPRIPVGSKLYTGVYGNGANLEAAWRNERQLFFQRLRELVDATQKAPRAVVAGMFGTSPAGDGFEALEPLDYEGLVSQYLVAAPPEFVPTCSVCEGSPLPNSTANWVDLVLYRGDAVVLSAEMTRKDPIVQVVDPLGEPLSVPLSTHYGFRSRLRIEP